MSNPPPPKKMPSDFEELEFTIDEEGWNEYELKDGVTIHGRVFLTKIVRDPNDPKNMNFSFSKPQWVVYAPSHMRKEPEKGPYDYKDAEKYEEKILTSHEPWNKYRIIRTGQKLKGIKGQFLDDGKLLIEKKGRMSTWLVQRR